VRTLDVVLLHVKKHTTEAQRYGTHCKGPHSFTYTPTHLSMSGMNHAFAFPAKAGPHFTDSGGDGRLSHELVKEQSHIQGDPKITDHSSQTLNGQKTTKNVMH